jgi:hypothetical protein
VRAGNGGEALDGGQAPHTGQAPQPTQSLKHFRLSARENIFSPTPEVSELRSTYLESRFYGVSGSTATDTLTFLPALNAVGEPSSLWVPANLSE